MDPNISFFDNGEVLQYAHADLSNDLHHPVSTVPVSQEQLMAFVDSDFMLPSGGMDPFDQPSAASSGPMAQETDNGFGAHGSLTAVPEGGHQPHLSTESETQLQEIHQRRIAEFKNMQRQTQQAPPNISQSLQLAQPPPDTFNRESDRKSKKSSRIRLDFKNPSEIVTLLVGEEKARFCIHKDVICEYSPVLNEQICAQAEKGEKLECHLEGVSRDTFTILFHWLYNDRIQTLQLDPYFAQEGGYNSIDNKAKAAQENTHLVKGWVLGERLNIPRFQNDVTDTIFNISCAAALDHFDTKDLGYVWEYTDVGAPLRALFIRLVMCDDVMDSERFDDTPDHFTKEFLLEFAKFSKMEDFGQDWHVSDQHFHIDVSGDNLGCGENVSGVDFGSGDTVTGDKLGLGENVSGNNSGSGENVLGDDFGGGTKRKRDDYEDDNEGEE